MRQRRVGGTYAGARLYGTAEALRESLSSPSRQSSAAAIIVRSRHPWPPGRGSVGNGVGNGLGKGTGHVTGAGNRLWLDEVAMPEQSPTAGSHQHMRRLQAMRRPLGWWRRR